MFPAEPVPALASGPDIGIARVKKIAFVEASTSHDFSIGMRPLMTGPNGRFKHDCGHPSYRQLAKKQGLKPRSVVIRSIAPTPLKTRACARITCIVLSFLDGTLAMHSTPLRAFCEIAPGYQSQFRHRSVIGSIRDHQADYDGQITKQASRKAFESEVPLLLPWDS